METSKKLTSTIIKFALKQNIGMVVLMLALSYFYLDYKIGEWLATALFVDPAKHRIQEGKVYRLSDLSTILLVGVVFTLLATYVPIMALCIKLDPYNDLNAQFSLAFAVVFTAIIWIKKAAELREFWETADPLPIADQGPSTTLPYPREPEPAGMNKFFSQLFHSDHGFGWRTGSNGDEWNIWDDDDEPW